MVYEVELEVREMKDKIIEWVIIIIVAIVLFVISDKMSVALNMNRRAARYLILAVVAFIYWIIDTARNKKG